jgi:hypothetical protein
MNRTTTIRLISAALLIAVLLIAVIGLPGGISSSAGQTTVTRVPRPHPKSHLHDAVTATPIGAHYETLYPRPHPKSHIKGLSDQQ